MRSLVCLVLALTAGSVRAAPPGSPFTPAAAVAPAELDGARGGFTAAGLSVSLGIERIVTVDGQVAARTELRLGDLGRLVGGAGAPSTQATGDLAQAGAGLAIRLGPDALSGTIVQNSLDGRAIGAATIIHASVGAQGMLQAMHFQSTLANALNAAVTGR